MMDAIKSKKIVYIEWEDAVGGGTSWRPPDEIRIKPVMIRSVGFVLAESKRSITLVGCVGQTNVSDDNTIPRSCIRQLRVLKHP